VIISSLLYLVVPRYCNRSDQRVARQQLCNTAQHATTKNNNKKKKKRRRRRNAYRILVGKGEVKNH
jgi:hypothetical protein